MALDHTLIVVLLSKKLNFDEQISTASAIFLIISSYSFSQASLFTPTWLDELRCLGTERRLVDCPANTIGDEDCTHSEDVALICTTGKSQ